MIFRIKNFLVPVWRVQSIEFRQGKVHVMYDGQRTVIADSSLEDFETAYKNWMDFHSAEIQKSTVPDVADDDLFPVEKSTNKATKKTPARRKRKPAKPSGEEE